jgi:transposase InsO family protein
VHVNVTEHPTVYWIAQRTDDAPRNLLRDRVQPMGLEDIMAAPRSLWQRPYGERLMGSIGRECLDHVIVLHKRHLRRLLTSSFRYYHHWPTHRALDMDYPLPRPVQRPGVGPI